MKTSDLIGPALDWAVAKCEGVELFPWPNGTLNIYRPVTDDYAVYEPDCRWAQGGPIIEREKISVEWDPRTNEWVAVASHAVIVATGPTPLIAAMRCYCCAKLGDEIEIPQELQPCQQPNL